MPLAAVWVHLVEGVDLLPETNMLIGMKIPMAKIIEKIDPTMITQAS